MGPKQVYECLSMGEGASRLMPSPVRLIACSASEIPECRSAGDLLAYCARVSSSANQGNHGTGPKLIRSLIRRREWSPLEMVSLTMEIVTTRDIARQILRHRSFSFQEFSQRYAVVKDPPVLREARLQHPTDRQASVDTDDQALQEWWTMAQDSVASRARRIYDRALQRGIAKEQARAVLPEGLTLSRLYVQGTLRSWLHYVALRTTAGTQKEHREIAEATGAVLIHKFPVLADVAL